MRDLDRDRAKALKTALRNLLIVAAAPFLAGFFFESLWAPRSDLWPRWQAHQEASTDTIDHGIWDVFLGRYVADGGDGINRVAYGQVRAAYRAVLAAYVERLSGLPVSAYSRPQQKAY